MDETTPTMRLLEQARAASARESLRRDLTTERRRIFSERFAGPMRPARAAWFAAWQAVADAADPGAAAAGLAAAGAAFRGMDCAAAAWLSAARDWLERARVEFPRLTCPVGQDTDPNPLHYPDAGEAEVAGWGADCGEFSAWASSISRLSSLAALPGMMRPATHIPADGPVRRGLGLLELTAAGASAADFRELLDFWGGVAWLAGLSATLAVSVAVPPPGHDFRPADLPSSGQQREAADSLLCLANGAYERCAHIEEFRRTHTAERQITTSPVRPAGGLTAENQMQVEATQPQPACYSVGETETLRSDNSETVEGPEWHADGPGEPLEFWYKGVKFQFAQGERRYFNLLVAVWPVFRLRGTLTSAATAAAYESSGGSIAEWKKVQEYAKELNGIIAQRIKLPARLESGKDFLRWKDLEES